METSARRSQARGIDTSERTHKLGGLKADRDRVLGAVREDRDLTPEARSRKLQELSGEYAQKIDDEADVVLSRIDGEIEKAYRRANPVERPSDDHTAELVREMRRSRIDGEVMEVLSDGADGVAAYSEAIRRGDAERAEAIARLAPRWLDPVRRRELAKMVDERTPQQVKDARERLQHLEAERRSVEIGLTMQGVNFRR